jgi:hypothetical protein
MNYKFKYAAGLPGYGINGKDGSTGLTGFSTYLMDTPEAGNRDNIEVQIKENKSLMAAEINNYIPGYPTRKYQNNDMFIDSDGKIFIFQNIGLSAGLYRYSGVSIGTTDFLDAVTLNYIGNDYTRYANVAQIGIDRKILDVVYGNEKSYFNLPSDTIYGIAPREYGQIFHSSEVVNGYNPYYLFNTGSAESKDALALTRDNNNGQFRIGNLDNAGIVRATNLNFDIQTLSQSRGYPQKQYPIISQYDIDASCLFKPEFDTVPTAISFNQDGSTVTVTYTNKTVLNVSNDNNINMDLVIYPNTMWSVANPLIYDVESGALKDTSSKNKYKFNIINNINSNGTSVLTGLDPNLEYAAYIEYEVNGWVRRSKPRRDINSISSFKMIKCDPDVISVDGNAHTMTVNVSATVNWSLSYVPTWVTVSPPSGQSTSLTVNISAQPDFGAEREDIVVLSGGGISRSFKIHQLASVVQSYGADYDTGWKNMAAGNGVDNGGPYAMRIRRYGKTVCINGTVNMVADVDPNMIIAQIPYSDIGGGTTGPNGVSIWFGSTEVMPSDNRVRSITGYIPAFAGQTYLQLIVYKDKDPGHSDGTLIFNLSYICD